MRGSTEAADAESVGAVAAGAAAAGAALFGQVAGAVLHRLRQALLVLEAHHREQIEDCKTPRSQQSVEPFTPFLFLQFFLVHRTRF